MTRVKLSLRSTPKALEVVFGFLRGRTVTTTMMAWTTVRCWLMRLGLYALLRPLEQANDWAYLIDHTVQIGTVKCFAVVGVRLSQLPYPRRYLQREDLVLIALTPMQQSNAVTGKYSVNPSPALAFSRSGGYSRPLWTTDQPLCSVSRPCESQSRNWHPSPLVRHRIPRHRNPFVPPRLSPSAPVRFARG